MSADKSVITVGASEIVVFMLSDGSYMYSVNSIAASIHKTVAHARSWLRVRGCYVQSVDGTSVCDPSDAVAYWSDMAENGNPEAYNLLVTLIAEALHNRTN